MKHAQFIADTDIVTPKPSLALGQTRKSIFKAFMEALHYSRRLQAERVLRQHRHLIDCAQQSIFRELKSRDEAERCWRDLGWGRRPEL